MVYPRQTEEVFNNLVDQINNFDLYYEMSDDSRIYTKGFNQRYDIESKLPDLTYTQKINLYVRLSKNGRLVWDRYFKK